MVFVMLSDDKLPSAEKLTDQNWLIWKMQMQAYLKARSLWGLIDGSESRPGAAASAADTAKFAMRGLESGLNPAADGERVPAAFDREAGYSHSEAEVGRTCWYF